MARSCIKERARKRILSDDEIRSVWEVDGPYGAILKLSLLTAQRRDKVASMCWQDVSDDGVWTLPTEPREKGNIGQVELPKVALDIIRTQPGANLAIKINVAHRAAYGNAQKALESAAECGRLLLEAKELVEHGEWLPGLEAHTEVS